MGDCSRHLSFQSMIEDHWFARAIDDQDKNQEEVQTL